MGYWTLEQRWEECYRRLLALNISHDKICRVWPLFVEYSIVHIETQLQVVPWKMDQVIDKWLAGELWPVPLNGLSQTAMKYLCPHASDCHAHDEALCEHRPRANGRAAHTAHTGPCHQG